MQAKGSNGRIIYAEESTFGTTPPASGTSYILPFVSEGLRLKTNLIKSNVIRGNRNATKPVRGVRDVAGSINTELNPYMGTILKHLIGGTVVTSGSGGYVHKLKIGALPTGLTIEKGFTDINQYTLYNGCKVGRASLEFGYEGVIPFNFDVMGQKRTLAGSSYHSSPTDLGHQPFEAFEATIEEGGSPIAIVSKVSMTLENDLDGGSYVIGGAGLRKDIPEGATLVSGTLTALFEDATLLNKAVNFTESSLKLKLTRGTGAGTAGNEYLEFLIPEIVYEESDPVMSGPKGVLIELPFAAFYDNATEGTSMQVVLKNTRATL